MGVDYDPGGASMPGEEMYEDEYGGGGGMPGGMPGQRAGNAGLMNGLLGMLTRTAFEKVNRPGAVGPAPFQPNLKQRAAISAARGDQREALAFFHAHLVTGRESAAADFAAVGYSALVRRPTWALRAGLSVTANIAEDLEGDAEPIREGMKLEDVVGTNRGGRTAMRGGRGAARNRSGGGGDGGFEEAGGPEESIGMPGGMPGAGMPGAPGAGGMAMPGGMPGAGMPGAGMPVMPGAGMPGAGMPGAGMPGAGMPGAGMPGAGMPGAGMPGAGMAGAGSDMGGAGFTEEDGGGFDMAGTGFDMGGGAMGGMPGQPGRAAAAVAYTPIDVQGYTHAALEKNVGMLADILRTELARRAGAGDFGKALPNLNAEANDVAAKYVMSGGRIAPPGTGQPMTWVPGIDYLGVGPANRMIASARDQGIDLLFHFDVVAKLARNGDPQYDARFRVIDCATGKTLAVSRTINKKDVLMGAQRRTIATILAELMQPAFDGIDARIVVRAMPPLQPQHAASRIESLLATSQPDRIDRLAEVALFHQQGLIDDEQLDQIFYFAAGEDGLRLLHDTPEKRQELAEKLVEQMLAE
ncbi:MAG: hypothetical protein EA381_16220 [Planctomycetaceae bacterium]|nr:MAG: hypothetical protein EA381_16220 [Planctomycetaceae bacterium]